MSPSEILEGKIITWVNVKTTTHYNDTLVIFTTIWQEEFTLYSDGESIPYIDMATINYQDEMSVWLVDIIDKEGEGEFTTTKRENSLYLHNKDNDIILVISYWAYDYNHRWTHFIHKEQIWKKINDDLHKY